MQQALQSYGQPNWSLKLLSTESVDPTQALAIELVCNKKFGSFCLDRSGLSQGAVKGIIAGGCFFLVLISALLCVFLDICRRSGRVLLHFICNFPFRPFSIVDTRKQKVFCQPRRVHTMCS